jgi:hypothetical protein
VLGTRRVRRSGATWRRSGGATSGAECTVSAHIRDRLGVEVIAVDLQPPTNAPLVAPFFSRVAAADGAASVRRAYTPAELARIVDSTGIRYTHSVAPFYAMQSVDIVY